MLKIPCLTYTVQQHGTNLRFFGRRLDISQDYSVSQKTRPKDLWQFFQNRWEFFNKFYMLTYYAFLSMLDYEFLFNYLQLCQNYAVLSMTTQFTSCVQNVHHRPKLGMLISFFSKNRFSF